MPLDFRILGPLEVVDHQSPVALGGPKQRALLAILLLHRGQVVSSERLVDELWGDRPPASAGKALQGYVSHLRKALGSEVLLTRGGGYVLVLLPEQLDAERFTALAAEASASLSRGDAARACALLDDALGLWRGEPLGDLSYEPFAAGEISRLEEARLAAVEDWIDARLALGHHQALAGELERLVALHPFRERLRAQLMLALYRSGRHTEALAAYQTGRAALADDLGLEPGPALRALEQRILVHDPGLEAPAEPPPGPPRSGEDARPAAWKRMVVLTACVLAVAAAIAVAVTELTNRRAAAMRAIPNTVAAIDPQSDRVVAAVPVGAEPGAIAFGSGSLWVANSQSGTISRIDPVRRRTVATIPLGRPATGLAAGGGLIWVVESNLNPYLTTNQGSLLVQRLNPAFDTSAAAVRIANVDPDGPGAVAAHGDSLWIAPAAGLLTRLNARTGAPQQRLDTNATPSGLAIGEGAVWIADGDGDDVVRVDPTGLLTRTPVGDDPTGIAIGDGSVWVADSLDDTLVKINPDTRAVTDTIRVGQSPSAVLFADGSVWVADSASGTVSRVDPRTDRITATIPVGGSPQALAFADGRIWITVDGRSSAPPGGTRGQTLKLVMSYAIPTMDPAFEADAQLLYETCAQLVNYPDRGDPTGSRVIPEVARDLPTPTDGGRVYRFVIRTGFRFSPPSGRRVTAQTFKDSIERTLNPRMHSPQAPDLSDIVGAGAYESGKAGHIAGLTASGNVLTIRLVSRAPDFLQRLAQPAFCAVPPGTPANPDSTAAIPSAGPYYVVSQTPSQGVVLARNPNYHGTRPRHFARIDATTGVPTVRAVREIESGRADYTAPGVDSPPQSTTLAALTADLDVRYGPHSTAAADGHQQYFTSPNPQLDFFFLNSHRPLFSDVRVRQAVNFAVDRQALAHLGDLFEPLPEHPTDHYLPPGMPGYRSASAYPATPDVARARALVRAAHASGSVAVLDTCDAYPCPQQAQIVKTDLARIGLRVQVRTLPSGTLFEREMRPDRRFDLAWSGWIPDYPDPEAMLHSLLDDPAVGPTLKDPAAIRELRHAAQISGVRRYREYGALDLDLARHAAPLLAFGNLPGIDFFSARIGCQVSGLYGVDLGALCLRRTRG
ncbi:MAG TPA: ABC transporter substrate-binding protein [Solirubrobacteraceae bacterium]|nr:ABC transporter substrate-binding protein [Solirubrobacteraceae bacterium]